MILSPFNYEVPILIMIGFALFIIGIFYFFINMKEFEYSSISLKFRVINENSINFIVIILMIITFFIPPVPNSEMIIEWSRISLLNLFRAIIFLIGCSIIPGSCIFKIFFPNNTIHQRFGVDPIIVKLVFYPLLSFGMLGSLTLILDLFGLQRMYFSMILFLSILIAYSLSLILQIRRGKKIFLNNTKVILSKSSLLIMFLAISIIIITLTIHLKAKYHIDEDLYRILDFTDFIGRQDTELGDYFYYYTPYWSYITFSISTLSGIPAINISVMLSPLIYLSITSLYLLMRSLLIDFKKIYAILSVIFAVSFSYLFYFINPQIEGELTSLFTYDAFLVFRYKSFATILFTISIALFLVLIKKRNDTHVKILKQKIENLLLIALAAFFLIQSLMIYYLPVIPALLLILILLVVNGRNIHFLKTYLIFISFLTIFFIFFDIVAKNVFSWKIISQVFYFLNEPRYLSELNFETRLFINSCLCYLLLIGFLFLNLLFYKIRLKFGSLVVKRNKNSKNNAKFIFFLISLIFLGFLVLEIILNLIRTIRGLSNFTFILHLFFYNLGFIGIFGIFMMYFCYKKRRKLFYILFSWFVFLMGVAFSLFFYYYVKDSFINLYNLPKHDFFLMTYWFNRIWHYTIIPLSIFASIGLIKIIIYYNSRNFKIRYKVLKSFPIAILISTIVFFSISNTIIASVKLYNYFRILTDEEAHIINWVSQNTPRDSKFLCDRDLLVRRIKDITRRDTNRIHRVMEEGLQYLECPDVISTASSNCSIQLIEEIFNRKNVLEFVDHNPNGSAEVQFKFFSYQNKGSIEFYMQTSNKSKSLWLNFSSYEYALGFSLQIKNGGFYYFNGSTFKKISEITDNDWYKMKFDFECSDSSYSGLNQYHWKVAINQSEFGEYSFVNNVSNIGFLSIGTSLLHFDYKVLVNDLNANWNPDFKIEYCLFDYLKIFAYLKVSNYRYLILSKENTEYKEKAEEYIDINNDLISKFYKNKLYEYQDLVIYSNNF